MPKYSYDFHIHSCLSPCAEDEMTPPNIANMACLKGLDMIAVTDHNSARNVRAVTEAATQLPLCVVGGLELCTSEEIHVICLFPTVEAAESAGLAAEASLPPIQNRSDIFGNQLIMDADEHRCGEVEKLLINATSISVDDAVYFAKQFGGICYPAHIDKPSYSILSNLGYLPDYISFPSVEVAHPGVFGTTSIGRKIMEQYAHITSSDAHRLADISERTNFIELKSCSCQEILAYFFHKNKSIL